MRYDLRCSGGGYQVLSNFAFKLKLTMVSLEKSKVKLGQKEVNRVKNSLSFKDLNKSGASVKCLKEQAKHS